MLKSIEKIVEDARNGKVFVLVDDEGIVQRIGNVCVALNSPELPQSPDGLHFTGIHAMTRESLKHIQEGFQCVVRSSYTQLVRQEKVRSIRHEGCWFDTGLPNEYFEANMSALRGEIPLSFDPWEKADDRFGDSFVHHEANVEGAIDQSIVGSKAHVSRDAQLHRCIVWDGVHVPAGVHRNGIFFDGGFLSIGEEK